MQDILYKLKNLNWTLVMSVLFLSLIGLIMIYSASNSEGMNATYSHVFKLIFGFTIMFIVALININTWQKYSFLFYIFGVVILIYATFYGFIGKGSRRWINVLGVNIQPSEIMKIFLIIGLAKFFDEKKIEGLKDYIFLLLPIMMIAIPFSIILNQPDLGTSLILLFLGAVVFFIVGINYKFFLFCGIIFLSSTPLVWNLLHEYQKQRLLTFFDPYKDPLGTGYHIIQSEIAIGSGGFFGKGWLKGTQSHLDFLPEKKTDFIFSMLGEEFGFLGTLSVIGLFVLICIIGYIMTSSIEKSFFSKVVGIAVITNFFISGAINMAMVMGLTPVVGIPLPLVSYGGSSMVTYFFGFGLLLSIELSHKIHKEDNLVNLPFFRQ
ncbi:MAG: rod shape-determining protein RodA [Rickettsiales bacterium]|nr:rod shape-determining protein RodA [Rickettsiales bacterium]